MPWRDNEPGNGLSDNLAANETLLEVYVSVATLMPYYGYLENPEDTVRIYINVFNNSAGNVFREVRKIELLTEN